MVSSQNNSVNGQLIACLGDDKYYSSNNIYVSTVDLKLKLCAYKQSMPRDSARVQSFMFASRDVACLLRDRLLCL